MVHWAFVVIAGIAGILVGAAFMYVSFRLSQHYENIKDIDRRFYIK